MTGFGLELVGSSPAQFEAFIEAEIAKWSIKDRDHCRVTRVAPRDVLAAASQSIREAQYRRAHL